MKIGLDFDGVISNCGLLKSYGARKLFGVDIPLGKFNQETVVGERLLTQEQYRELQRTIYGTREIGLLMEPVEGALRYISRLVEEGHIVTVITSRSGTELQIAREWSRMHGLNLDFVGVGQSGSKANIAKDMGIILYVDDDMDKLETFVGAVGNLFLFSWGYNAHINIDSKVLGSGSSRSLVCRVYSWAELYERIYDIQRLIKESMAVPVLP
jgi:hypothetical protein